MYRYAAPLGLILLAGCQTEPAAVSTPTGAQDYAGLCSGCHGPSGSGDGPGSADLAKRPADLTALAAGNGGEFPMARVMGHIWGYTEVTGTPEPGRVMPDFGSLLESDLVLFDSGDGISTPTPSRLVELAVYLKSLQP
jgi:mono/diheme cytochrome c family protein